MPKFDFRKVAKFSCKFAAYFLNNFLQEYLWTTAPEKNSTKTLLTIYRFQQIHY